jgi:hypothetical protein
MVIEHKLNHVVEGLGKLISQYAGKPNIEAVLTSYLNQIQELEDVLYDLMILRWIDNAEGAQLDGFGQIVDEPRLGKNDTIYKLALKAKRSVIMSQGTPNDILDTGRTLLPVIDIEIIESYPAYFTLYLSGDFGGVDWFTVKEMISASKPIGVGYEITAAVDDPFTFDDPVLSWDQSYWSGVI